MTFEEELDFIVLQTNREFGMTKKLQGLAAKVAKLHHDAEFEAAKLEEKVDREAARMPGVFSGAHKSVDNLSATISDVASSFDAIEVASNGGPVLEDDSEDAGKKSADARKPLTTFP